MSYTFAWHTGEHDKHFYCLSTCLPLSKLATSLSSRRSPLVPSLPNKEMNTLASVPAPRIVPVLVEIMYVFSSLIV